MIVPSAEAQMKEGQSGRARIDKTGLPEEEDRYPEAMSQGRIVQGRDTEAGPSTPHTGNSKEACAAAGAE